MDIKHEFSEKPTNRQRPAGATCNNCGKGIQPGGIKKQERTKDI